MVYPSGTVTLLFTDIEGSTRLWEADQEAMRRALARHDSVAREHVEAAGGQVFKTVGDAFCAVFAEAPDAVASAVAAQRALGAEPWPQSTLIRVRMALHSGGCVERDGDYFGPVVNRVARLLAVAHGGQILCSGATYELAADRLGHGVSVRDLGVHRLKDLGRPERVFQLSAPGLAEVFGPLRS
jgi:class 3 adenylate cyclase